MGKIYVQRRKCLVEARNRRGDTVAAAVGLAAEGNVARVVLLGTARRRRTRAGTRAVVAGRARGHELDLAQDRGLGANRGVVHGGIRQVDILAHITENDRTRCGESTERVDPRDLRAGGVEDRGLNARDVDVQLVGADLRTSRGNGWHCVYT